jgi:hypothetical protein
MLPKRMKSVVARTPWQSTPRHPRAMRADPPISVTLALLLRDIGVALYGPTWRPEMARHRNVSNIVVKRWELGVQVIPIVCGLS